MFANGKAAMAFNGSWCVNVYGGMNPGLKYGAFPPPKYSDNYQLRLWGSAGASLLVNAQSKLKEETVAFLKWLTMAPQQIKYARQTNNIPANKKCVDEISPILAQFAKGIALSTHPNRWPIMEEAAVLESFHKGIQLIIIGQKTPQEIAREARAVKER